MTAGDGAASVRERLEFIGFDGEDRAALRGMRGVLARTVGPALDRFYRQITAHPVTSKFFSGDGHVAGAKRAQTSHWDVIAGAEFDTAYVDRVRTIGRTHARIGLEPRWYVAGYSMVAQELVTALIADRRFASRRRLTRDVTALMKAILLDLEISISVYLETSDEEVIDKIGTGLARLAEGDLTHRVAGVSERFTALERDFNAAAQKLETSLTGVAHAAETVRVGADEISAASNDLGMRTERQAGSLEETAASMRDVTEAVKASARSAAEVRPRRSARPQRGSGEGASRSSSRHSRRWTRSSAPRRRSTRSST
jgi:methyl-accepting chemotaxis protein